MRDGIFHARKNIPRSNETHVHAGWKVKSMKGGSSQSRKNMPPEKEKTYVYGNGRGKGRAPSVVQR